MRDEQVKRYARHIQLADIGWLGQTALMVARARLPLRESDPAAELIAASYLAAGGVGTIAVANANEQQRAALTALGPDSRIVELDDGEPVRVGSASPMRRDSMQDARETVTLAQRPAWWPSATGDHVALAFWRGGAAAAAWMIATTSR